MNILIIDDDKYKVQSITKTLNGLLENATITVKPNRNAGLFELYNANKRHNSKPFDLAIIDNYMPLDETEYRVEPFAEDILMEIDRLDVNIPTIVCSSEPFSSTDIQPTYYINFDISVDGNFYFKPILTELGFIKTDEPETAKSDFVDVINKLNSICKSYDGELSYGEDLEFCPLYHANHGCNGNKSCIEFILEHPEEAEKIIKTEAERFSIGKE